MVTKDSNSYDSRVRANPGTAFGLQNHLGTPPLSSVHRIRAPKRSERPRPPRARRNQTVNVAQKSSTCLEDAVFGVRCGETEMGVEDAVAATNFMARFWDPFLKGLGEIILWETW